MNLRACSGAVLVVISLLVVMHSRAQTPPSEASKISTKRLLRCLNYVKGCPDDSYDTRNELIRRKPVTALIGIYRRTREVALKEAISETLYYIDDPRVEPFMRSILEDDHED